MIVISLCSWSLVRCTNLNICTHFSLSCYDRDSAVSRPKFSSHSPDYLFFFLVSTRTKPVSSRQTALRYKQGFSLAISRHPSIIPREPHTYTTRARIHIRSRAASATTYLATMTGLIKTKNTKNMIKRT